jgi:hypothetical protein
MLFHLSIDADNPKHVAEVFAEIWNGRAVPFPPVAAGSWMALAGDERNNLIEVYPRGTELVEVPGDADATGVDGDVPRPHSPTHMAIGTKLTMDQIFAIARREGWPAKYRKRGGAFGVIEFWIEGWRMVEVLTPEMQQEYLALQGGPAGAHASA